MWALISGLMLVHAPVIQSFAALHLWRAKCDHTASCSKRYTSRCRAEAQSDEGVGMYLTTSLNGVRTIQQNGRNILGVWNQNWEFACEICDLPNFLEDDPHIFLTEHDRKSLKAINRAFRKVQHA
jgi:hypothetical protein